MSERQEVGIECTCGFKRRATQISNGGKSWNGREIQALHAFHVEQECTALIAAQTVSVLPIHVTSMGLLATSEWLAVTGEEQKIGEAYLAGVSAGDRQARARMKMQLDRVTASEFTE